jgi:integrase
MSCGEIRKADGTQYKAVSDYIKVLKSFWHWWMKVNRKRDIEIKDITLDLDTKREKPDWVYLTEEQIKKLCSHAKFEYKVLMMFLYDTGIRAPTELMNIKVSDFYCDFKELNIRDEISKTFGRRIKLMLSSELIKEYIQSKNLGKEDYLFKVMPWLVNRYLRTLAKKVLGDEMSQAGQRYSQLSMYDFRHNACCYWLPRYKSESALKYRFGWKKSDKIHYYSELLGMRDTISEQDLMLDVNKSEIEKELVRTQNEKNILQEQINVLQGQFAEVASMLKQLKVAGLNLN